MSNDQLAEAICELAADKKAVDVVALDLRGVIDYTDFFVVCSGTSDRQVKAIADGILYGLKEREGVRPARVEGLAQAHWVLMDYLDVIVHVFIPEVREYYALERLWGEVPQSRPPLGEPASLAASSVA